MVNIFITAIIFIVALTVSSRNAVANTPNIQEIKDDVPKAADYLSDKLRQGKGGGWNKFENAYSDIIPQAIKNQYTKSDWWNPEKHPDDYIQCTTFVNGVYLWQYPNFPWFHYDAITYLNASKENGFTVYKNGETKDRPRPGDILVWPLNDTGHVGLIKAVEEKVYVARKSIRFGIVRILEANTPDKESIINYFYDKDGNISFGTRNYYPKPTGWVHWDKTAIKNNWLGINFIGCPAINKEASLISQKLGYLRKTLNATIKFGYDCEVDPINLYQTYGLGGAGTKQNAKQQATRITATTCGGQEFSFIPPEGYVTKEVPDTCFNQNNKQKQYIYYELTKEDTEGIHKIEVNRLRNYGDVVQGLENVKVEAMRVAGYSGSLMIIKQSFTPEYLKKIEANPEYRVLQEVEKREIEKETERSISLGGIRHLSVIFNPAQEDIDFPLFKMTNDATLDERYVEEFKTMLSTVEFQQSAAQGNKSACKETFSVGEVVYTSSDYPDEDMGKGIVQEVRTNYIKIVPEDFPDAEGMWYPCNFFRHNLQYPPGMEKPIFILTPPSGSKSGMNACTAPQAGDVVYTNNHYEKEDKQYLGDHGKEAKIIEPYGSGEGILFVEFTQDQFETAADCNSFSYK